MNEDQVLDLCEALPERFSDRLDCGVLSVLRMHAEGGEWGELVDNTVSALVQQKAVVTAAERDDLAALVSELTLKTAEPVDRLTVQG